MSQIWDQVLNEIKFTYFSIFNDHINSRKDFALDAVKFSFRAVLFKMLDGKNIADNLKWERVKEWGNE